MSHSPSNTNPPQESGSMAIPTSDTPEEPSDATEATKSRSGQTTISITESVPKGKDIGRQQTASHDLEALVKQAEKLKVEEVPYPTASYILPTTSTQPSNDDPPHDRKIPPSSHCASVKVDPPITGLALEELDVRTIINQHGLRHNINFEPGLSYQPDHYSTQGQQARRNADRFWSLLKEQLYAFLENPDEFERHHVELWTLPTLLATIKEILITVVPSEYCQTVAEALKVELIMQQLSKGAVDLSQLAGWFSQTLKGQCAPMRDTSVDAMTVLLCNGTATKDVPSLVEALKNILSILEVMRLDVANHQLQWLKQFLIRDTVIFEQAYHIHQIAQGRVNVPASYQWFQESQAPPDIRAFSQHQGGVWAVLNGFTELLRLVNACERIPCTLRNDKKRIITLRAQILDATNLGVCLSVARDLLDGQYSEIMNLSEAPGVDVSVAIPIKASRSRAGADPDTTPHSSATTEPHSKLNHIRSVILAILDDYALSSRPANAPLESLASCRSRWQNALPAVALEIVRNTGLPWGTAANIEKHLRHNTSNESSPLFDQVESQTMSRLGEVIAAYVLRWERLDNNQLYEAANFPSQMQRPQGAEPNHPPYSIQDKAIDKMARVIAQVCLLHWRIWGDIIYRL